MGVTYKPSAVQSSTTSGTLPAFPNFSPDLVNQPGGQDTNISIQSWWTLFSQAFIQLQNNNQQGLINQLASASGPLGNLQAQITHEETVRAAADSALATSISTVSATLSTDISMVAASVTAEATARADADGFLQGKYTLTVTAGNVVTGMNITSSTGSGTDISTVIFQASDFLIYNGSSGVPVFEASGGIVTLGNTLVINQSASKVYIGVGTFANSNTPLYIDSAGNFSLGAGLTWNTTTLAITGTVTATSGHIGGWTIGSTTISANNAILDSAGQLSLGTSNDVVFLSATDATYRLWIGNVTASAAAFSVTKTGHIFAGNPAGNNLSYDGTNLTVVTTGGTIMSTAAGAITFGGNPASQPYFEFFFGTIPTSTALLQFFDAAGVQHSEWGKLYFQAPQGSSSAPGLSFFGASNTGINATSGSELDCIVGGVVVGAFTSTGIQSPIGQTTAAPGTFTTLRAGSGLVGTPGIAFSSDPSTGIWLNAAGDMRFSCGGSTQFIVRSSGTPKIVCLQPLQLANAFTGGAPTPNGYVTVLDDGGNTIQLAGFM